MTAPTASINTPSIQTNETLALFQGAPFGQSFCPWMLGASYTQGAWEDLRVIPTMDLRLSPAAKALHYGVGVFEGIRAFRGPKGVCLFRPEDSIRRFRHSAEMLELFPYPEKPLLRSLCALVAKCRDFVPEEPGSLYLRPLMLGTSSKLGVAAASDAVLLVLANPMGMQADETLPPQAPHPRVDSAWISSEHVRAVRGGLGSAKAMGNYAASIRAISHAARMGFDQVLFLDAIERRFVEEFSGMNFFCVDRETLKTPPLNDSILAGITRNTLLRLALELGIPASEEPLDIKKLIEGIQTGDVTEIMGCGTGSAIISIGKVRWGETVLTVSGGEAGPVAKRLLLALCDIQYGRKPAPDPSWLVAAE